MGRCDASLSTVSAVAAAPGNAPAASQTPPSSSASSATASLLGWKTCLSAESTGPAAAWHNTPAGVGAVRSGRPACQRSPARHVQLAWAFTSTATPPTAGRYLVAGYDGSAPARRAPDAA
jgi:hypothetical protein